MRKTMKPNETTQIDVRLERVKCIFNVTNVGHDLAVTSFMNICRANRKIMLKKDSQNRKKHVNQSKKSSDKKRANQPLLILRNNSIVL